MMAKYTDSMSVGKSNSNFIETLLINLLGIAQFRVISFTVGFEGNLCGLGTAICFIDIANTTLAEY